MPFKTALCTACGMSFFSMTAMEAAMEVTDVCLTGSLGMNMWAVLPMLLAGWLAPLPYNYWRLKKFGKSCH